MSEPQQPPDTPVPKKRHKGRRWLIVLIVILLGVVWLSGPGLRFLAPVVVKHYLEKAGMEGDFNLSGNVLGGLALHDLKITGDKGLSSLTIDKIEPEYDFRELTKGKLRGLTLSGVHADLKLGEEAAEKPEKEKKPLDLKALVQTIRDLNARVRPMRLDFTDISVAATQEGKPAFSLSPSSLTHQAGSDTLTLSLGTFTDAQGKVWPAQQSDIVWTRDQLAIAQLNPVPSLGIRNLTFLTPAGGEPSLNTELLLDDGVFQLTSTPGFATAKLALREGQVQIEKVARNFGADIPAAAKLTSLEVDLENLLPDPTATTGVARLLLEDISSQGWDARELALDATLTGDTATVAARAMALNTPVALDASVPITRAGGHFSLGEMTGTLKVVNVSALMGQLAARLPAINPEAPVPASSLDGNFRVSFVNNQATAAVAGLLLNPADREVASPVEIKARWVPQAPLKAEAVIDGLKMAGSYATDSGIYQATLDLESFTNSRIDPWLAIFRVNAGGKGTLSGRWNGSGNIKTGNHTGDLSLRSASWQQPEAPGIDASAEIAYNWPGSFEIRDLLAKTGTQSLALDADLRDGLLSMTRLLWKDGENEIASGKATLPVPEDFTTWRNTLSSDTRPLNVDIESRVLSLALLKQWVPAAEQLDPRSTGQLTVKVSGTYGVPEVYASFVARDLRSPKQPNLPPADLKIEINGREGQLTVEGEATAPDFPAATFKANMPFTPSLWAADPEKIKGEPIAARVDLPRLDVSRFTSLVTAANALTGTLTGNVTVGGTVGKPEPKGELNLTGGGLDFKSEAAPDLSGLSAALEFNLQRVELKNLRTTVSGGTLQGEGTVSLAEGKVGDLDVRVRGDHLPIIRNESLIIRAVADLRLQGPWDRATLSGSAGTVDSIFFKDIEILPIGTPFTTPSAASLPKTDAPKNPTGSVPEPFRSWALNVDVSMRDPFLFRGNIATGSATGRIQVRGTIGTPAPTGSIRVRDVRASLPFSTLLVRDGFLRFTPQTGFDPVLEIRGNAEPRPYRVDVYIYGQLSNPQLVLTSNPPLPENEIMTLLATGTTTSGLEDPQAASSRALQLLVEELRRGRFGIGKQLRPLLGLLDRVDFSLSEKDPYSNDSYSTATISLTDRWFVSAGMGADGGSRVLGIWRLSFR